MSAKTILTRKIIFKVLTGNFASCANQTEDRKSNQRRVNGRVWRYVEKADGFLLGDSYGQFLFIPAKFETSAYSIPIRIERTLEGKWSWKVPVISKRRLVRLDIRRTTTAPFRFAARKFWHLRTYRQARKPVGSPAASLRRVLPVSGTKKNQPASASLRRLSCRNEPVQACHHAPKLKSVTLQPGKVKVLRSYLPGSILDTLSCPIIISVQCFMRWHYIGISSWMPKNELPAALRLWTRLKIKTLRNVQANIQSTGIYRLAWFLIVWR